MVCPAAVPWPSLPSIMISFLTLCLMADCAASSPSYTQSNPAKPARPGSLGGLWVRW